MAGGIATTPTASPDAFEWLAGLLWRRPEQRGLVVVRRDGKSEPGYRLVARYFLLSSRSGSQFLVPAGSPPTMRACLLAYNRLRPRRVRLVRSVTGRALSGPMRALLPRERVDVFVRPDLFPEVRRTILIEGLLGQVLAAPAVFAAGLHPDHQNRKPVLQIFDQGGSPLGYAKIGWNEYTRSLVETEARTLRTLAGTACPGVRVPSLIWQGTWGDLSLALTAPLPLSVHSLGRSDHSASLRRFAGCLAADPHSRTDAIGQSTYWKRLHISLAAAAASRGTVVSAYLRHLDGIRDVTLRFGRWHGDWVPWNMGWAGEDLWVWDWEHSDPDAPLGFDIVHGEFQHAFVVQRRGVGAATQRAEALAAPQLAAIGMSLREIRALVDLYLAEIFARHERAVTGGAGGSSRFYPEILAVLAQRIRTQPVSNRVSPSNPTSPSHLLS